MPLDCWKHFASRAAARGEIRVEQTSGGGKDRRVAAAAADDPCGYRQPPSHDPVDRNPPGRGRCLNLLVAEQIEPAAVPRA